MKKKDSQIQIRYPADKKKALRNSGINLSEEIFNFLENKHFKNAIWETVIAGKIVQGHYYELCKLVEERGLSGEPFVKVSLILK